MATKVAETHRSGNMHRVETGNARLSAGGGWLNQDQGELDWIQAFVKGLVGSGGLKQTQASESCRKEKEKKV